MVLVGAALGLHCCVQGVLMSRGYSLAVVCWRLVEHDFKALEY